MDPDAFYLTDHYRPYPAMLIRLKQVRADLLARVIEQAWRSQAPKSLLTEATTGRVGGVPSPRRRVGRRAKRS